MAEGDLVIMHGRFTGFGAPMNWIAADLERAFKTESLSSIGTSFRMSNRRTIDSKPPIFGSKFQK